MFNTHGILYPFVFEYFQILYFKTGQIFDHKWWKTYLRNLSGKNKRFIYYEIKAEETFDMELHFNKGTKTYILYLSYNLKISVY